MLLVVLVLLVLLILLVMLVPNIPANQHCMHQYPDNSVDTAQRNASNGTPPFRPARWTSLPDPS